MLDAVLDLADRLLPDYPIGPTDARKIALKAVAYDVDEAKVRQILDKGLSLQTLDGDPLVGFVVSYLDLWHRELTSPGGAVV